MRDLKSEEPQLAEGAYRILRPSELRVEAGADEEAIE